MITNAPNFTKSSSIFTNDKLFIGFLSVNFFLSILLSLCYDLLNSCLSYHSLLSSSGSRSKSDSKIESHRGHEHQDDGEDQRKIATDLSTTMIFTNSPGVLG